MLWKTVTWEPHFLGMWRQEYYLYKLPDFMTVSSFPGVKQTEIFLCIFRACKMKAKETNIAVPLNVTVPDLEI